MSYNVMTSESVSPGHPDKICDQIADAILDAFLEKDKYAKVACEVFITTNFVLIGGEVNSRETVDYEKITRKVIIDIGYNNDDIGFNGNTCEIKVLVHQQSPDILQGVDLKDDQIGAGDQGIMVGYACNETPQYLPISNVLAHELLIHANALKKEGKFLWALHDMKSQVTIDYNLFGNIEIKTILMSIQHQADYDEIEFKKFIHEEIMQFVAKKYNLNTNFEYYINPTGKFVIGGPNGDTGLTGRKLMVDTYGNIVSHGGGAFSGKDPTKVDRAAAYYARYIAKNIVASGLASKCEVKLAYIIGKPKPISISVNTYGTLNSGVNRDKCLIRLITSNFDCSVKNIIDSLKLREQKYQQTATYGHFGRDDLQLPWEQLDKVKKLKKYADKTLMGNTYLIELRKILKLKG